MSDIVEDDTNYNGSYSPIEKENFDDSKNEASDQLTPISIPEESPDEGHDNQQTGATQRSTTNRETMRKKFEREYNDYHKGGSKFPSQEPVKNIFVYRNGDKHFKGKRLIINRRQIRTWGAFLENLTSSLHEPKAIRYIRTPNHGTRINNLEDLQFQGHYVALGGGEKMQPINYQNIENELKSKEQKTRYNLQKLNTITDSYSRYLNSVQTTQSNENFSRGIIIQVFRNGDEFTPAVRVLLTPFERRHIDLVLHAIDERVILKGNAPIQRIYNMEGKRIRNPEEFEDGKHYIAAAREPCKKASYGTTLPLIRAGPFRREEKVKFINNLPTPPATAHLKFNDGFDMMLSSGSRSQNTSHPSQKSSRNQKKLEKDRKIEEEDDVNVEKLEDVSEAKEETEDQNEQFSNEEKQAAGKIENAYLKYRKRKPENKTEQEPQETQPAQEDQETERKQSRQQEPEVDVSDVEDEEEVRQKQIQKDKIAAAKKIQSSYRGYRTRRTLKENAQQLKDEQDDDYSRSEMVDTTRIDPGQEDEDEDKSEIVGELPNDNEKENAENAEDDQEARRQQAAIKIQSNYKGYRTRKQITLHKQNEVTARRERASAIIQAGYRAQKTRKQLQEATELSVKASLEPEESKTKFGEDEKTSNEAEQPQPETGSNETVAQPQTAEEVVAQRHQAAKTIQAAYRAASFRKTIDSTREQ